MKCKKIIIEDEIGRKVYQCEDNSFIVDYTDEINITPKESAKIKDIGSKFSCIASFFFDYLAAYNIPTGYKKVQDGSICMQKHVHFPFFIKILNLIDKRTAKIFNKSEGQYLTLPIFTFHSGNGSAALSNETLVSETHLISLDICPFEDLKIMKRMCSKINAVLKSFFERRNLFLAEINCSFGKDDDKIFLVDDFTPRSFKIINNSLDGSQINPYRIKTADDYKKYTEFILSLTNS